MWCLVLGECLVPGGVPGPKGVWSWGGVPGPRGLPGPEGVWSAGSGTWSRGGLVLGVSGLEGVPGLGGVLVSQHALRQTPLHPPREMATSVDGMHPTGMYSCTGMNPS